MKGLYTLILASCVLLFSGCTKQEDVLTLNEDYLHVSDVLQYCQGSCSENLDWEGSDILLKGHVQDVENDSIFMDYYDNARFYLLDIRNGLFLEVQVVDNRDPIFEVLQSLGKQDELFLEGVAAAIILNEGDQCEKGVVIEISKVNALKINP